MMTRVREWFTDHMTLERFTVIQIATMVVGGLIAAGAMRPWLEAGPVRVGSYVVFAVASLLLTRRYYTIIKSSDDGRSTIVVIASFLWWGSFSLVSFCIIYLIMARAWGFLPGLSGNMQERVLYFFISGAAIGALYKAITFRYIPPEELAGRRVSAWPITWRKRQAWREETSERQDRREEHQDRREQTQDVRDKRQSRRGAGQDRRGEAQDKRGQL